MMCEQTGQEIDWEKCPADWEDFPERLWDTIEIFNSLGDRIYPDVGYVGKDYTNLKLLFKLKHIPKHLEETILDLLLYLDARNIKLSQEKLKAEHAKIKQKHGGR